MGVKQNGVSLHGRASSATILAELRELLETLNRCDGYDETASQEVNKQVRDLRSPTPPPQGHFRAQPLPRPDQPPLSRRGGMGARHATGRERTFAGVVTWTILGALVPGWGLAKGGARSLGRALLIAAAVAVVLLAVAGLTGDPLSLAESVAIDPAKLTGVAVAAAALALAWALLVLTTHVCVRRHAELTRGQRLASGLLVVALIGIGVLPALKIADYALLTRQTLVSVFGATATASGPAAAQPNNDQPDPWAGLPRVNVLLIGSDAGADRTGVRPDTMIVASINTRTGDTVLFSLPRNLQHVPFPPGSPAAAAYPDGFYCINPANGVNTDCLLNGMWTFGQNHAGDYYKGATNPGLTATVQAAQQISGLTINNYAMINLDGFKTFVNAIGGLTINVKQRLPIGGNAENPDATSGWIEPGRQKLDGYHALWYARSRWSTNDYDRMRRQRCVIGALSQQADPLTLAQNFPAIARAAQHNIQIDIRLDQLPAWVQLAKRIQHAAVRSLPFTNDVIDTTHPDFTHVHALVQQALQPAAKKRSTAGSGTSGTTKPQQPSSSPPAQAAKADDVRAVC